MPVRRLAPLLAVLAVVALVVGGGPAPVQAAARADAGVEVQGVGTATGAPDVLHVTVGVEVGGGTVSAALRAANDAAGNVPYTIKGIPVLNSLSFYYYSQFRLTDPRTHHVRTCSDMLARCPKVAPPTP